MRKNNNKLTTITNNNNIKPLHIRLAGIAPSAAYVETRT